VTIADLLGGSFHASAGDYDPAYVNVRGLKITRVNIVARVARSEHEDVAVEDGTGEIRLRWFNPLPEAAKGDVVRVIGKIREAEGERFISVEALKKLGGEDWLELHKKDASLQREVEEASEDVTSEPTSEETPGEQSLQIEQLDYK
jgi:RPA family protein